MKRYNFDNFLPFDLCLGPKQPKDLDSFLIPFIDELKILHIEVSAYDAFTKTSFLLKTYLMLVSENILDISKLLHLNEHMTKLPCRACKIENVLFKISFIFKNEQRKGQREEKTQYYYLIYKSTNSRSTIIILSKFVRDFYNLSRRIAEEYIHDK